MLDTDFIFIKEAVVRWVREVWLLGSARRPADALSPMEVVQAARRISEAMAGTCKLRQGPLLALKEALVKLGWQLADNGAALKAPTTGASDTVLELRYVSPK